MKRRGFLKWTAGAVAAPMLFSACARSRGASLPSFLVVVSDQQHFQAFGAADASFHTPNFDALLKTGHFFTHAFAASPQCSPSRSSLYTGLYPHKTGVMGNIGSRGHDDRRILGLKEETKTIGDYLLAQGYRTGYVGKWHLGPLEEKAAGYERGWFDTVQGGDDTSDSSKTRHAMEFLQESRGSKRPFALFVNYRDPHDIYDYGWRAPPKPDAGLADGMRLPEDFMAENFDEKPRAQSLFMERDSGRHFWKAPEAVWKTYRGFYRKRVAAFDAELGKVLKALKNSGLWEQTIVVVTSDHGDMDAHHRLVFKGPFAYDQIFRVPLAFRVPAAYGGQGAGLDHALVSNIDLVPTLLDFASVEADGLDGLSLKHRLTGKVKGNGFRPFVVGQYYNKQDWVQPLRMIRTGRYKYVRHMADRDELYDLSQAPSEVHNLIEDKKMAPVLRELRAQLEAWQREEEDPWPRLSVRVPRGYGKAI